MTTPPAHHFTMPAWVNAHDIMLGLAGFGVLLVIALLARAIGRLSKALGVATAPAPAPKSSGGKGKLLLLAGAAGAVIFGYVRLHHPVAAASAKGTPTPAPTASPAPTVTRTVGVHVTPVHFHLPIAGGDVIWIFVIAAVVAIVLLGPVLRRSS